MFHFTLSGIVAVVTWLLSSLNVKAKHDGAELVPLSFVIAFPLAVSTIIKTSPDVKSPRATKSQVCP